MTVLSIKSISTLSNTGSFWIGLAQCPGIFLAQRLLKECTEMLVFVSCQISKYALLPCCPWQKLFILHAKSSRFVYWYCTISIPQINILDFHDSKSICSVSVCFDRTRNWKKLVLMSALSFLLVRFKSFQIDNNDLRMFISSGVLFLLEPKEFPTIAGYTLTSQRCWVGKHHGHENSDFVLRLTEIRRNSNRTQALLEVATNML